MKQCFGFGLIWVSLSFVFLCTSCNNKATTQKPANISPNAYQYPEGPGHFMP